jgi:VanZ family protein
VALGALVVYVAALAIATLGASPTPAFQWATDALQQVTVLDSVTLAEVERLANVLLFVPAGLLLCYALPRTARWRIWALCVLVSACAELAQLVLPGRDPSVIDVLTNATGAAIGVLLNTAVSGRRVAAVSGRR